MTVAELIAELQKHDPQLPVITESCCEAYRKISLSKIVTIVQRNGDFYPEELSDPLDGKKLHVSEPAIKALEIV